MATNGAVEWAPIAADIETDRKTVEKILKSAELHSDIEDVWVCALKHGPRLFDGKMDLSTFVTLLRDVGLVKRGAQAEKDEEQYKRRFLGIAGDSDTIDFPAFVRTLCHVAMYRHGTEERIPALKVLMDRCTKGYVSAIRQANVHDGYAAGPVLAKAMVPDGFAMIYVLDRVLYRYDQVLTKVFDQYKNSFSHEQKAEVFEPQVLQQMAQTMEVEDMRDLLKDFGLFPGAITMLDICKLMHFAVFGREPVFAKFEPDNKERAEGTESLERCIVPSAPLPNPYIDVVSGMDIGPYAP